MWRRGAPAEEEVQVAQRKGFRKSTASAFLVIFFAEWGDLTQLATATLAAKYAAPLTIFVSATLALWAVTGLGVSAGHFARNAIQPKYIQRLAAVAFGIAGLVLLVRAK
jgi:putative Ca2+/H+ antiporter (TMEM165/GDT1 family)